MDRDEQKKLTEDIERAAYESMSDPRYWARKRAKWDEWGSPVGLTIAWALFIIPLGLFIYLMHISGLI